MQDEGLYLIHHTESMRMQLQSVEISKFENMNACIAY